MTEHISSSASLPDAFLASLVAELDHESVRAIILRGSYVRGDAKPPYSDIDLTRIVWETPDGQQSKRYIWRDGYAVSISTWSLSAYQERIRQPEEAIFVVPGIQEARLLLEKDGAFRSFQHEVLTFQWESLQTAANAHAGQVMMNQTEIILKMLRALRLHDMSLLAEMLTLDLLPAMTEAFAVQQGIRVRTGNTYFHQIQEAAGLQSAWTRYFRCAVGIDGEPVPSLRQRGIAALRLFQETTRRLQPSLHPEHWEAIEPLIRMIDRELSLETTGSYPYSLLMGPDICPGMLMRTHEQGR
jgi:hypothetical protein